MKHWTRRPRARAPRTFAWTAVVALAACMSLALAACSSSSSATSTPTATPTTTAVASAASPTPTASAASPTATASAASPTATASAASPTATASAGAASATKEVDVATVGKVGKVLVNSQGYTLYMFMPDKQSTSTCTAACAALWPPVVSTGGSTPTAGSGVQSSLLGTSKRPDGSTQVTYNKWPLYRFAGDTKPGEATGQGLDSLGGYWYVMAPDGTVVK